ncbi:MAG: TonB-dependent receptor plug domain-containing protein [Woeseiaceae bacterium]|nr:TonB-dependent receptor plug domain-containing protein [Woeseiaceae bacterium]
MFAIAAATMSWQAAFAQETDGIEEVIVTGRFISSSQQLVDERMNDAFATDLLGADTIARLGDSTVAAALRRVPGLSLVQGKFVYIRGLGERYSQTTLNNAQIPSPDLTRNVIPLDVFPTAVVESLRVQKSWSPNLSANFGGGAVDIRTRGIPDGFTFRLEVGLGSNTANPGELLTYPGGGDDGLGTDDGTRALSPVIIDAMTQFQGSLDSQSILNVLRRSDPAATIQDAQAINRELALELNRSLDLQAKSTSPDYQLRGSIGNKWDVGTDWQLGFGAGASYKTDWRWSRARTFGEADPETFNGVREETTRGVNIAGTLNLGVTWTEDHQIETTTLYLRNTDDETEVFDFRNEERSGAEGFRDVRYEFEERNMLTNQVRGTHYLGDATREKFPFLDSLLSAVPQETRIEWFYSDSTAETNIPNRVLIASQTEVDAATGEVTSSRVRATADSASFRFVDLDDQVENYGWSGTLPIDTDNAFIEISGGYDHSQKVREYRQLEFGLGIPDSDLDTRAANFGDVYSDSNILNGAFNSEISRQDDRDSYLAATMTDAVFGQIDYTWRDTWRVAAGARWEDYRQAAVAWDPHAFNRAQVEIDPDDPDFDPNDIAFSEDKVYPSVGLTYMGSLWAETFQLRLGYSETAVRPDLREITSSSYTDPVTGILTRGNPGVVPSEVENIDLRAEWFFSNRNSFTATLFAKDILKPIGFFEVPASDTTIARSVFNATSAEVRGIELEGLVELGFLGDFASMFFVQGNVTLQETELVPGNPGDPNDTGTIDVSCLDTRSTADATEVLANNCKLPGASEYVANIMIGFDSPGSKHTMSLLYNVFGERLFALGRRTAAGVPLPDPYEQPFHSLDLTYFWYPTDTLVFKAKVQNILGSKVEIERGGILVFEEDPGTSFLLSASWGF